MGRPRARLRAGGFGYLDDTRSCPVCKEEATEQAARCGAANPVRSVAAFPLADVAGRDHPPIGPGCLRRARAACLAVLADALEECGCSDPHVLAHLRGSGPHV